MVYVSKIIIDSKFSPNFIHIEFEIKNTFDNLSDFQFDILRSGSPDSDFEVVAIDVKNFEFSDYSAILTNPTIRYFYKIRITDKTNNEVSESDIKSISTQTDDNYVFFMNHVNSMYLRDILDNKAKILKRKRFGEYCECYDDVREKSTKQNCTMCYGTKFKGGYYDALNIDIGYYNSPTQTEKLDAKGIIQTESPIQIWTTAYPPINQGDVIMLPDNSRYKVMTWSDTDKHKYSVRQIVQIQKIPQTDIIYKLPVKGGE